MVGCRRRSRPADSGRQTCRHSGLCANRTWSILESKIPKSQNLPNLPLVLTLLIFLVNFRVVVTIPPHQFICPLLNATMSLPIPSTSGTPIDPKQLQALDAPLIALTQQCGGDLRRLMFAFFSFLHRRTDFYLVPHPDDAASTMGFREGDAEKLLLAAFRQFPLRRIPKGQAKSAATSTPTTTTTSTTRLPSQDTKPTGPKDTTTIQSTSPAPESTTPAESKGSSDQHEKTKETKQQQEKEDSAKSLDGLLVDVKYNENGLQIPVGNGGSTKRYTWTQTIQECTVLIGVPKVLRGKDLDVKITSQTLTVKSKLPLSGETEPRTFVEGPLVDKIRPDDSSWTVEGGVVIVTLEKSKPTFWKTVLEGDEEIDTELVDNRRHIDEYDDATQAKIRKIIFDQEQYHKGGPTSDEILGEKSTTIPPLPPGVEYIDKKKLDEEEAKKKKNKNSNADVSK